MRTSRSWRTRSMRSTTTCLRVTILASLAIASAACWRGRAPAPVCPDLPPEPQPCVLRAPPTAPALEVPECPAEGECPPLAPEAEARLAEYLDRLEMWSARAWDLCGSAIPLPATSSKPTGTGEP